ncbi:hypothetical protein GCM10009828_022470 [Actinoplanes couchii]|uniref:Uncharacterized protein n=1 Tax=Actinoplanes couchii TaxID=403638 RepID=A0ABQ3XT89_9ACTN|nr:hypothetical protein Aco03nite_099860 [Actinoplanes couchii]
MRESRSPYRNGTYRAVGALLRGGADPVETMPIRDLPGDLRRQERLAEHVAAIEQAFGATPLVEETVVWRAGPGRVHRLKRGRHGADRAQPPVGQRGFAGRRPFR